MQRTQMAERLRLEWIVVQDRRREDFGDIDGLAASLARYGLLHPVVVDDDNVLVAGERRLRAARSLGWEEIDARRFSGLTKTEKDEIELEENLQRKDLSPHEQSKTVVRLAETAAEVLKEQAETRADSTQVSKGSRGPSRTPGSLRDVAERIGVPEATIRAAQKHVETAEAMPVFTAPDVKQYHVLEAREKLERLPEGERPKATALINQAGIPPKDAIAILGNLAEMPAENRQHIFAKAESADSRDRSDALTEAAKLPPMPDPRAALLIKAIAVIQQAERMFPDDPMTPAIAEAKAVVDALRNQLRRYRRDDAA